MRAQPGYFSSEGYQDKQGHEQWSPPTTPAASQVNTAASSSQDGQWKPPWNIFRNVDQNIFQMVSQGRGRGGDKKTGDLTSTDLTTTDGSDSVTSKDSGEFQRDVYLAY